MVIEETKKSWLKYDSRITPTYQGSGNVDYLFPLK